MTEAICNKLANEIIIQAVEDFRDLCRRGVGEINNKDTGEYGIKELEEFFRSDWCRALLRGIGCSITDGVTILRQLKSENA